MLLGGEKRLAVYKKEKEVPFVAQGEGQYVSLMPIEASEKNLSFLIASAKLAVTSGWDMAKGFHKPSVSWIPAGAVFNSKVNDSCIPLGK